MSEKRIDLSGYDDRGRGRLSAAGVVEILVSFIYAVGLLLEQPAFADMRRIDAYTGGRVGSGIKIVKTEIDRGQPTEEPFLTPLPELTARLADDPALREACRGDRYEDRCAELLYHGGPGSAGPVIAPAFAAEVRNLRIAFVLTEISNTLVSGNGIALHLLFNFGVNATPNTIHVSSGMIGPHIQPGTSESFSFPVWTGIVPDGCIDPPAVIAVEFHNDIREYTPASDSYAEVGVFEAEDNTSLVPTGYWSFDYTVRAEAEDGDASDFRIRGTVSVVCTN
jgi:hypothetical protein